MHMLQTTLSRVYSLFVAVTEEYHNDKNLNKIIVLIKLVSSTDLSPCLQLVSDC
jgi:hypothetical protein